MTKELVSFDAPELSVIEESKANQIKATFEPMAKMLSEFEDQYNNLIHESQLGITKEITAKAKRLRLDIGKVRIDTEKIRKEQKEEYLRAGKAIDGVSNILKWAVSDKENKLKEIEDYFDIIEQKRLEDLQNSRVCELSKYVEDAHERSLSLMEEDVWQAYLTTKKKEHEDRIEAEKQAELDRLEIERKQKLHLERKEVAMPFYSFWSDSDKGLNFSEISDSEFDHFISRVKKSKKDHEDNIEKQRIENERLKKEAEAKEKALEKERQKAKEEADRLKAENEAKLRKEKEDRERLEVELKAKKEAEEKAIKEAEAKRQAELSKGDSDKLKDLLNDLDVLKTKYSFKSDKNKKMYSDVSILIDKVIAHIQK